MEEIRGLVFDIEEFAVFDGPGIRTAVFLKGCPLRCNWCHNPEGLNARPERMVSSLCVSCGACRAVCPSPGRCVGCGRCVPVCKRQAIRIVGKFYTADALAQKLLVNADLLRMNDGGVTFTGGECAMQTDFVLAVREKLPGVHCAIETSGYCDGDRFERLIRAMDLVMLDLKHTDPAVHQRFTGVDNGLIRQNLDRLIQSGVPFIARVPVIPGVNDTEENLNETARWLKKARNLVTVELLPYNRAAGAKYKGVGRTYRPDFDETRAPNLRAECFERAGLPVRIL